MSSPQIVTENIWWTSCAFFFFCPALDGLVCTGRRMSDARDKRSVLISPILEQIPIFFFFFSRFLTVNCDCIDNYFYLQSNCCRQDKQHLYEVWLVFSDNPININFRLVFKTKRHFAQWIMTSTLKRKTKRVIINKTNYLHAVLLLQGKI